MSKIQVVHEPLPKIDKTAKNLCDPNKLARALADPNRKRIPMDFKLSDQAKTLKNQNFEQ